MTIVVTGAAGHVGGNLVRALLARGQRPRAMVHVDQRALDGLEVEIVPGDVREAGSLTYAFEGAEVVYHAAGYISLSSDEWPLLEAINVRGTRNVVEACLRCGVRRLVHFSSIEALEQTPLDVQIDESRRLVDTHYPLPYARSKAMAQREVQWGIDRGLDAVILNPTAIIGPDDQRLSHMGRALLALARGRLPALVSGGFDWVDVRDVVQGALLAEKHAPAGGRYILSGHWASMRDLAAMVAAITGAGVPRFVFPIGLARLAVPVVATLARLNGNRPLFTTAALEALRGNRKIGHARATADLGYHPRPIQETLWDTLRWFQVAGYLPRALPLRFPEVP